jgi:hypothetical protein
MKDLEAVNEDAAGERFYILKNHLISVVNPFQFGQIFQ